MLQRIFLLTVALCSATVVHAELPPGSYDKLKIDAGEKLIIQATKVIVVVNGKNKEVTVEAKVLAVEKTDSALKVGQTITIKYGISGPPIVGPQQAPELTKDAVVPAFLKKGDKEYGLAAHGQSFTLSPES